MKLTVKALAVLILFLPLAGCWNATELNNLAIVSGWGVDTAGNGKYLISVQIVLPAEAAARVTGGAEKASPVVVYSTVADSFHEGFRQLSNRSPQRLYFSHQQVVVFGEEAARRRGIYNSIDVMSRDREGRLNTPILVTRGKAQASDLLRVLTPLEKITGSSLNQTVAFTEKQWGESLNIKLKEVMDAMTSEGRQPVIPSVRLVGDPEVGKWNFAFERSSPSSVPEVSGIAYFKNDKLAGFLNGDKARGAAFLLDRIKSTNIILEYGKKKNAFEIEIGRSKGELEAKMKDGKPELTARIQCEGGIAAANIPLQLYDVRNIHVLEKALEGEIRKDVKQALRTAQRKKLDIFGFGDVLHRSSPKEWNRMKGKWDEIFARTPVKLKVEAYIRHTGLRTKSPEM